MRVFITAVAAALCALLPVAPSSAGGPYGSIKIGNWFGGAYTYDQSGQFSHCAAGASYQSGIFFLVMINAEGTWRLGFSGENWRLVMSETLPIALTFDGGPVVNVYGKPINTKLLGVDMPTNSSLINQFRKASMMTAFTQGQLFHFNLTQTSQLLPALTNCVASVRRNGVANAGDFTVAPQPRQAAVAAPPAPASAPSSASAPTTRTMKKSGTGFVISSNGHIVTNHHVIKGCGDISGNLTGEAPVTMRLVSSDETNDLALLQAPVPFKDVAVIRANAVTTGDGIVALGYPYHGLLTSDLTVTTGIVSSLSGLMNDTRHLQISAAVQPGNSGGPLLDAGGNVVGVVDSSFPAIAMARMTGSIPQNINFAIKTGALRDFLDNSVVPYQTADSRPDSGKELRTSEIAKTARTFTLLISCTATEQGASGKPVR